MGGFLSKLSEEIAPTMRSDDAIVLSAGDKELKFVGEKEPTRYVWDRNRARPVVETEPARPVGERKLNGSSNSTDLKNTVDAPPKDLWITYLVGAVVIIGAKTLAENVINNYWSYLCARHSAKVSEGVIKNLLALPNTLRDDGWKTDLDMWVKKRDTAAEFMKKHKFAGKLVKMFPPSEF